MAAAAFLAVSGAFDGLLSVLLVAAWGSHGRRAARPHAGQSHQTAKGRHAPGVSHHRRNDGALRRGWRIGACGLRTGSEAEPRRTGRRVHTNAPSHTIRSELLPCVPRPEPLTRSAALKRFIDGILVAVERGTPWPTSCVHRQLTCKSCPRESCWSPPDAKRSECWPRGLRHHAPHRPIRRLPGAALLSF